MGTRQHARLLYLLGVEQIIVGINKMDACNWSQDRFQEIKDEFVKMLQQIGYKPKKVPFIPFSGYNGDNLVQRTDKAPWYKGWTANLKPKVKVSGFTIVDALNDFIHPPKREPDLPLRMPISNIYNIKGVGQIIAGTVEQGTIRPGDVVGITPGDVKGKKIFSIARHWTLQALVNLLVCPSRDLPKTRRSTLVISSTWRRKVLSNQSSRSRQWLWCRSILESSSQDTLQSFSLVPQRLLAE